MDEKVDVRETAENGGVPGAKPSAANGLSKDNQHTRMNRILDPAVLGSLTIEVVAQLGRGTMTIEELASLNSGEVVKLDTPLNAAIDLTLNGTLVARGEIVAVDDQFGVRITEILVHPQ